jgi:dCMP deaminase
VRLDRGSVGIRTPQSTNPRGVLDFLSEAPHMRQVRFDERSRAFDLRLFGQRVAPTIRGHALRVGGVGEVLRGLRPFEGQPIGRLRPHLIPGLAQSCGAFERLSRAREGLGDERRVSRVGPQFEDDASGRAAIVGPGVPSHQDTHHPDEADVPRGREAKRIDGERSRPSPPEHAPPQVPWRPLLVNLAVSKRRRRERLGLCAAGVRRNNAWLMDPSSKAPGRVRASWDEYFMNIAREVSTRSTCDRKFVGAVIVRDKSILATGYNGSIRGLPHCDEEGHLMEEGHCVRTVHAEANAIVQAARNGVRIDGSSIYVTASPCWGCFRLIANAGIARIAFGEFYRDPRIFEVAVKLGIELVDMSKPAAAASGAST